VQPQNRGPLATGILRFSASTWLRTKPRRGMMKSPSSIRSTGGQPHRPALFDIRHQIRRNASSRWNARAWPKPRRGVANSGHMFRSTSRGGELSPPLAPRSSTQSAGHEKHPKTPLCPTGPTLLAFTAQTRPQRRCCIFARINPRSAPRIPKQAAGWARCRVRL